MPELGQILTAIVTPFDADGRIDDASFVRLANHLFDNGSDGLVVCGSTGEAATLTDDEQVALIELAVREVGERGTIIGSAGSNDTRHAVELTERVSQAGVDAILSVTPYYVRPDRRGIVRHFELVAAATDKPVVLYNVPTRTATDMPNDLLAELAQIDGIEALKQARSEDVELIDGLDLYAGNDDTLAAVLDLGGAGGILVASHIVGDEMRRMADEPERRAEIDAGLQDVYAAIGKFNPIPVKAALNLLGHEVGGLRLPMVEAGEETKAELRSVLERHGLLAAAT
jgi:4-hydroxy-tetrahydrodipicolinate synthase